MRTDTAPNNRSSPTDRPGRSGRLDAHPRSWPPLSTWTEDGKDVPKTAGPDGLHDAVDASNPGCAPAMVASPGVEGGGTEVQAFARWRGLGYRPVGGVRVATPRLSDDHYFPEWIAVAEVRTVHGFEVRSAADRDAADGQVLATERVRCIGREGADQVQSALNAPAATDFGNVSTPTASTTRSTPLPSVFAGSRRDVIRTHSYSRTAPARISGIAAAGAWNCRDPDACVDLVSRLGRVTGPPGQEHHAPRRCESDERLPEQDPADRTRHLPR